MNELYANHKNIIQSISRGLARKTGIPADELESEANMIFTECANRHPEAEHFERYLRKSLNWGLYRYVRKRSNEIKDLNWSSYEFYGSEQIKLTKDRELREKFLSYDKICEITFENMSRDAKKIIELIFDKEYIDRDSRMVRPKLCKKHIFSYLKNNGWKTKRILTSFNELTELVNFYQMN